MLMFLNYLMIMEKFDNIFNDYKIKSKIIFLLIYTNT